MSNISSNNKRLAKNTLLLYFRMILLMIVSLYTSRVILSSIGIVDYGIYNIVGGFVGMFSMISGSLNAAINRFMTFELGVGNINSLKRVFSTALTVQIILSVIIICLAETVGLWYINNVMVIPSDRLVAANWCYQFTLFTFVVNLISLPFNASIISHEQMSTFAYVSIFDAFGKLLISYIINYNPIDRLSFYGLLLALFSIFVSCLYIIYCKTHFEETTIKITFDKPYLKKMFSFAGWNFIGAGSGVMRDMGGNLLLNYFFGPVVNAARGISESVKNAICQFSSNFTTALNPQITKSYATKQYDYMFELVYRGSRFSAYLMLLISIPIILNTQFVLELWLKEVPEHAVLFTQLTIIYSIVETISYPLVTSMLATGKIRNYQIVVGGIQCLNLPISFVLLYFDFFPESIVLINIFIAHCCLVARLYMLKGMINLNINSFVKNVYLNIVLVALLSFLIPLGFKLFIKYGWINFIVTSIISILSTIIIIVFVGCIRIERDYIFLKAKHILNIRYKKHDCN